MQRGGPDGPASSNRQADLKVGLYVMAYFPVKV
jgi:hypothetical protein